MVVLYEGVGELYPLLGIDPHDTPEQVDVVRLVVHLLRVQDYLLELTGLCEALDNLDTGWE